MFGHGDAIVSSALGFLGKGLGQELPVPKAAARHIWESRPTLIGVFFTD